MITEEEGGRGSSQSGSVQVGREWSIKAAHSLTHSTCLNSVLRHPYSSEAEKGHLGSMKFNQTRDQVAFSLRLGLQVADEHLSSK